MHCGSERHVSDFYYYQPERQPRRCFSGILTLGGVLFPKVISEKRKK
jgi:hypothetical protein